MGNMKYWLGHRLLCAVGIYELHPKSSGHYCCIITAVSAGSATRRENIACVLLQLLPQPGGTTVTASAPAGREAGTVLGYAMAAALSAVSARRKQMCLQFLPLLKASSSLSLRALPAMASATSTDSVNRKTVGTVSSISNTVAIPVSRGSSQARDRTHVSYISHPGRQITV